MAYVQEIRREGKGIWKLRLTFKAVCMVKPWDPGPSRKEKEREREGRREMAERGKEKGRGGE